MLSLYLASPMSVSLCKVNAISISLSSAIGEAFSRPVKIQWYQINENQEFNKQSFAPKDF